MEGNINNTADPTTGLPQTQPPTPKPVPTQPTLHPKQSTPYTETATQTTQQSVQNSNTPNDPLLTNKTFSEDLTARWNSWKCMVCGYVYEGVRPRTTCPRCGNSDPDKFLDID